MIHIQFQLYNFNSIKLSSWPICKQTCLSIYSSIAENKNWRGPKICLITYQEPNSKSTNPFDLTLHLYQRQNLKKKKKRCVGYNWLLIFMSRSGKTEICIYAKLLISPYFVEYLEIKHFCAIFVFLIIILYYIFCLRQLNSLLTCILFSIRLD